ncbi:hypothetical protein D3C79_767240 [compost metagenome]
MRACGGGALVQGALQTPAAAPQPGSGAARPDGARSPQGAAGVAQPALQRHQVQRAGGGGALGPPARGLGLVRGGRSGARHQCRVAAPAVPALRARGGAGSAQGPGYRLGAGHLSPADGADGRGDPGRAGGHRRQPLHLRMAPRRDAGEGALAAKVQTDVLAASPRGAGVRAGLARRVWRDRGGDGARPRRHPG